jgi:multiple sugar transport system permease protein
MNAPTKRKKPSAGRAAVYALLVLTGIVNVFPFYWMLRSSLMTKSEIFALPMLWLPSAPQWGNYLEALVSVPFGRYFTNSLFLVAVVILGKLLSSSLIAYGFARIDFKGRNICFALMISTMMIPWSVLLIPQFIIWTNLNLYNSYWPLVLPSFFLDAFYVFLLRQFFQTLPMDYDEAATIDGASHLTIYSKIILPLSKPALLTVCVFAFMYTWNDFIGPLIYLKDQKLFTVSLGLQQFIGQYVTEWHLMMAAATVAIVPMIVIFFFAQRYFIEGIAFTGIKG